MKKQTNSTAFNMPIISMQINKKPLKKKDLRSMARALYETAKRSPHLR